MIVVDTNVLAYFYLPTEFTTRAQALMRRDPDWNAPVLWRSEFRNVLAGMIRRKTLTFDEALTLQAEAEGLLSGGEYEVDSRSVMELVRDSDCSAYDCEFMALARRLNVPLVTMDAKLFKAFLDDAIPLAEGEVETPS